MYVNSRNFFKDVLRMLDGTVESVLPQLVEENGGKLSIDVIRKALDSADKIALEALETLCASLGVGLAGAVNFLNPSHVVIGGPFARLGDHLLGPLLREVRSRAFSRAVQALDLSISELAVRPPGIIGAAIVLEARLCEQGTASDWQNWR